MNKEEYKTGLWNKQSKNGTTYATGKIKIENKEYKITLFTNANKTNEKSPDFNVIIQDSINIQENEKASQNGQINVNSGKNIENPYEYMAKVVSDDPYENLGKEVKIEDDAKYELPF